MESLSFSAVYPGMLLSAVICAVLARSRGYSGVLYGGLGILLNIGAIPLTMLATSSPLVAARSDQRGFTPASGSGGDGKDFPPSPQLLAWSQHYHGLRQGLALAGVACLASCLFMMLLMVTSILPTFVALFEGMSLQLPWSTRILVEITKFVAGPNSGFVFWSINFSLPAIFYAIMVYAGYWIPLIGSVWRSTDRMWLLLSRDHGSALPPEVVRRLGTGPAVEVEDLAQEIQCERDRLGGATWMAVLGIVPLLGFVAFAGGLLIISVFLPFYQLVGSLG